MPGRGAGQRERAAAGAYRTAARSPTTTRGCAVIAIAVRIVSPEPVSGARLTRVRRHRQPHRRRAVQRDRTAASAARSNRPRDADSATAGTIESNCCRMLASWPSSSRMIVGVASTRSTVTWHGSRIVGASVLSPSTRAANRSASRASSPCASRRGASSRARSRSWRSRPRPGSATRARKCSRVNSEMRSFTISDGRACRADRRTDGTRARRSPLHFARSRLSAGGNTDRCAPRASTARSRRESTIVACSPAATMLPPARRRSGAGTTNWREQPTASTPTRRSGSSRDTRLNRYVSAATHDAAALAEADSRVPASLAIAAEHHLVAVLKKRARLAARQLQRLAFRATCARAGTRAIPPSARTPCRCRADRPGGDCSRCSRGA